MLHREHPVAALLRDASEMPGHALGAARVPREFSEDQQRIIVALVVEGHQAERLERLAGHRALAPQFAEQSGSLLALAHA